MKDFFEHQAEARRNTALLLFYFLIAIVLIILTLYAALKCVQLLHSPEMQFAFYDAELFILVGVGSCIIITGGSLFKRFTLSKGGSVIAEMLGGRLIPSNSYKIEERRLLNVVEEVAIASGTPVPVVYLMEEELGINAFAAGFSPDTAVIGVTKGTLECLNRDELQGVIAHEFSHILNGDMLLNIRMIGVLHGILLIGLLGESILRGLSRVRTRGKGSGAIVLIGAVLYIIGYSGLFFGKLIKSAVSRQREFLADASAVQFTRNPLGLSGALKKIGGLSNGSKLRHSKASEASHLYFGNGISESWFDALNTHPPLEERIHRLDPTFRGRYPKLVNKIKNSDDTETVSSLTDTTTSQTQTMASPESPSSRSPLEILNSVGAPGEEHMALSKKILAELHPVLKEAAREPFGARALIYGLLIDGNEKIRNKQLNLLNEKAEPAVCDELRRLLTLIKVLPRQSYLPVIDLSMPALRSLSTDQHKQFAKNVLLLASVDKKISLFEYILQNIIIHYLKQHDEETPNRVTQIYSLRGVTEECSCVLSVMAHLGHRNQEDASQAFTRAVQTINDQKITLNFSPVDKCSLNTLDKALKKLNQISPVLKKRLLASCLECISFDNKIKMKEVELFRAVAAALDCPVPIWTSISSDEVEKR